MDSQAYGKNKFWFGSLFVEGLRRIGKTTLIKYMIKRLVDSGVNPKDIIYVSCDGLAGWTELRDILRFYSKKARVNYFFIDEASFISDWSRAIKYTYDVGLLRKSFVVVTGSHAMDIMRGVEKLPGRRGEGADFVLLPATFGDFVSVVDPKLYSTII